MFWTIVIDIQNATRHNVNSLGFFRWWVQRFFICLTCWRARLHSGGSCQFLFLFLFICPSLFLQMISSFLAIPTPPMVAVTQTTFVAKMVSFRLWAFREYVPFLIAIPAAVGAPRWRCWRFALFHQGFIYFLISSDFHPNFMSSHGQCTYLDKWSTNLWRWCSWWACHRLICQVHR